MDRLGACGVRFAVAAFGSLNTSAGDQLASDRGALMGVDPGLLAGPAGGVGVPAQASTPYLGAYQDLMAQVRTETYANGFYIVAVMSLVGACVALFMRSGRKKTEGGGQAHVVEL